MATLDAPETGQGTAPAPALPGHSVDDLRVQGKASEARAEFERLIQEGMDSGVDPRSPATIFDAVRAELRSRTTEQTDPHTGIHG